MTKKNFSQLNTKLNSIENYIFGYWTDVHFMLFTMNKWTFDILFSPYFVYFLCSINKRKGLNAKELENSIHSCTLHNLFILHGAQIRKSTIVDPYEKKNKLFECTFNECNLVFIHSLLWKAHFCCWFLFEIQYYALSQISFESL